MTKLTEPKTGRSIAVRFKNMTCEQHRDSRGRFTSQLVYYVDVEAVLLTDQKSLDEILEDGSTRSRFQIGVIER